MDQPIDEGLPPGVPFFTPDGKGVDFAYVQSLRDLLGLRLGQSLHGAIARLAAPSKLTAPPLADLVVAMVERGSRKRDADEQTYFVAITRADMEAILAADAP